MGRFSTNFRTRAREGKVPAAVLEVSFGAGTDKFSDAPIASVSQGMYEPRIISWGSLTYSATDRTSSLQSPELTVDIQEPTFWPLRALQSAGRSIIGGAAKVYLAYDDIAFADWFLLFDGQVSSYAIIRPRVWRVGLRFNDAALASAVAQLYIRTVDAQTFPTALDDSLGKEIPIVYGKNEFTTGGILKAPKCATDGDPESATAPHRYIVSAGHVVDITKIYNSDGSVRVSSPTKDTNWFWTERNNHYFTEVGSTTDTGQTELAVDVWGLSDVGEGSTGEADLIINPAKQIEHLLTNFIFNRWKNGDYFTASSQPIDTASITTVESYFDKVRGSTVKKLGSNILRGQSSLAALNDWAFQNQVAVSWNVDGKLRFALRDPFDADIYLDNNTPANWPWFETDIHGRGNNSAFPLVFDDMELVDQVDANMYYIDSGNRFRDVRIVNDFERTETAIDVMDLKWAVSDGTPAGFDVPSRRLRRLRLPVRKLSLTSSIALLDPNLLDAVLVQDPDMKPPGELKRERGTIWKTRLYSLIAQEVNLNNKTVKLQLEEDRDYRCTFWHTGRGEIAQGVGFGVPILSQVTQTFTRATKAWVPNSSNKIVRLTDNIPKHTPQGWLLEGAATNWFTNPGFVGGFTDWTTGGTPSLETSVLQFEPETAADLSGTNQTVKLKTVTGPVSDFIRQTTSHSFITGAKVAFSVSHRDNDGEPVRVRIQNTGSGNWLQSNGTWAGGAAVASSFADSGGVFVRDELKFTNDTSTATLQVDVFGPANFTKDCHVSHVQIEDSVAFPTSMMVSSTGATFTRNRDELSFGNSDPDRSFRWFDQGTFRCTYEPLFDAADMKTGDRHTIFEVLNNTPTTLMKMLYEENSGTARFNLAWDFSGADSAVATINHDVVAGEVYKVVGTWIGSNDEYNRGPGDLSLWVYDPVSATWLADIINNGTQNAETSTGTFRIGDGVATPFTAWGYIGEFEVLPFVLDQSEIKEFP